MANGEHNCYEICLMLVCVNFNGKVAVFNISLPYLKSKNKISEGLVPPYALASDHGLHDSVSQEAKLMMKSQTGQVVGRKQLFTTLLTIRPHQVAYPHKHECS